VQPRLNYEYPLSKVADFIQAKWREVPKIVPHLLPRFKSIERNSGFGVEAMNQSSISARVERGKDKYGSSVEIKSFFRC